MPTRGAVKLLKISSTMNMLINRWEDIKWAEIQTNVFKWQQEIASASKLNDIVTVRKLQHRILASKQAKLLAIRRVTQDNQAKSTAGIDDVKTLSPNERLELANSLEITGKGVSPLRRVWIPKPNTTEKRPLGIPTIRDRCTQALFTLALEPEWEAKFAPNSYGFRPGRNRHDAIVAIRRYIQKRPKCVFEADVTKCFDTILHEPLLEKIGMKGKYRRQLKAWLKAGILDSNVFSETEMGTPGLGISPLLANIALHGLEDFLKQCVKHIPTSGRTGKAIKLNRRIQTLGIVTYAGDLVILHHDLSVILLLREKTRQFLATMGLQLSNAKTRITHTLGFENTIQEPDFDGCPGFDFLGFTIRQFKTIHNSAKGSDGEKLGLKTLIVPSKQSIKVYQAKLHKIILQQGKTSTQKALINKLNPIIREWSNYFGQSDANTCGILSQMDYLLYLKVRQWSKRQHKTSGKGAACFKQIGNYRWTFAADGVALLRHVDYTNPLSNYISVKVSASYFQQDQIYWANRVSKNNAYNTRVTKLLKA
jgi:RNA-directed DNA polymerase